MKRLTKFYDKGVEAFEDFEFEELFYLIGMLGVLLLLSPFCLTDLACRMVFFFFTGLVVSFCEWAGL